MVLPDIKNNMDYYSLKKVVSDLKQDLKHMKRIGIDPRAFLGGKCADYVSQFESLLAVERQRCKI
nr:hypothetical protein [Candidatus Sigynarchaeota archaeon]